MDTKSDYSSVLEIAFRLMPDIDYSRIPDRSNVTSKSYTKKWTTDKERKRKRTQRKKSRRINDRKGK